MAKTNPIGVRFDQDLLFKLKEFGIEATPQKALSIYEDLFNDQFEKQIYKYSQTGELSIYKLINPIDKTVFYVGRTSFLLPRRLRAHISQTNSNSNLNKRKISILKTIQNAGLKPIIELLESFNPASNQEYKGYHEREIYWIVYYLNQGQPITNKISQQMIDDTNKKHFSTKPKVQIKDLTQKSEVKSITEPKQASNYSVDTTKKVETNFRQKGIVPLKPETKMTLDKVKELCPKELTGFERSSWIATERQKYSV